MALPFYNYLKLMQKDTVYARKMLRLSNRIFGEVSRPTTTPSMKVVKILSAEPHYKRDTVVNYYPRHVETALLMKSLREYGLYRDEHEDFKEEMVRLRALRGKVRPPKRLPKPKEAKEESAPTKTT